jgi:hypothetical protein
MGRSDLDKREAKQVRDANQLIFTFLAIAEAVANARGIYLGEHPRDPETEPMPSLFATSEFRARGASGATSTNAPLEPTCENPHAYLAQ